uniref:Class I SAM-dependent methyltransferase n=1 Tax=Muribaculaceae bacterium Z82 TaxID=2304548 RepID=A0A7C9N7W4_9BACT
MSDNFTPLLTSYDWNAEWQELQRLRRRKDDSAYWDKRAATFTTKDAPNRYVEDFLRLADIKPGETVFDMGCGTGALAVPLGQAGHKVVAADFSQGMLDAMQRNLDAAGVTTVFPKCMSWDDDWAAFGVRTGMVDVAIASRSIATDDLRNSLMRLTDVARRRVCITLSTGSSPRVDERILSAVGLSQVLGRDYLYAFNILADEGLKPQVDYINSTREDTFATPEDAYDDFAKMIRDAGSVGATEAELAAACDRLRGWLEENLEPNPHAGERDSKGVVQGAWHLKQPRIVAWAFIAWEK